MNPTASLRLNQPAIVTATLVAAFTLAACKPSTSPQSAPARVAAAQSAQEAHSMLEVSPLPYHYPQFDKLKDDDFGPAIVQAMQQAREEVAKVAANPEAPSFDNTIVALERGGQALTRVYSLFANLTSANTNDVLDKTQADIAPKLAAFQDEINLDPKLYARVKTLYDQRDTLGLDAESRFLLERRYTDLKLAGAELSEPQKTQLKALNEELAKLSTQFEQNTLKEINDSAVVVKDVKELDGLTPEQIAAAADAAKERKLDGQYLIKLQNTTGQPPLAQLKNRALRERIYRASIARGTRDNAFSNRDAILKTVQLRAQRAELLGYPNHASYQLQESTAGSTAAVNKLLTRLAPPAVANARVEAADLQKIIDSEVGNGKGGFKLAAWDWSYYAEKLRAARYEYDDALVKPYFEFDRVLKDGVFYAAGQLYGISFKERKDLPVYQPDVRTFEVFEESGTPLGILIVDPYARASKQGGAWMTSYVDQSDLLKQQQSVVGVHLNIPKPPAGKPTLLTADETETLFHETGHALHGLFSKVKYPTFSGTNVFRDFVEYPSQANEMWATDPKVLANYAKHYQTGEPLPQALLKKIDAMEKFDQGFATTEYLAASVIDQAWHQLSAAQAAQVKDVNTFERSALDKAGLDYAPVPPRYHSGYFSHVFSGGYSAGYYAYIWSEVLVADTVQWFKDSGGATRKNGQWYRDHILSRGGSADAMSLYRAFRGGEPSIEPLLKSRGLDAPG